MSYADPHIQHSHASSEVLNGLGEVEDARGWKNNGVPNGDHDAILHDAIVDTNTPAACGFYFCCCGKDIRHIEGAEHFHGHDAIPASSRKASDSQVCSLPYCVRNGNLAAPSKINLVQVEPEAEPA